MLFWLQKKKKIKQSKKAKEKSKWKLSLVKYYFGKEITKEDKFRVQNLRLRKSTCWNFITEISAAKKKKKTQIKAKDSEKGKNEFEKSFGRHAEI